MGTQSKFDEFISSVLAQVRFAEAHAEIRRELKSHLEEAMDLGVALGHSEQEVEVQVIRQMGHPFDLGKKLDEVHRPKFDLLLLSMVAVLLGTGLYALALNGRMALHLLWVCLGILPLAGLNFSKMSWIRRCSWPLYGLTALLLLAAFMFGAWYEGQLYLALGFIKIKVVDFSVVLFSVSLAGPISGMNGASWKGLMGVFIAALMPIGLYLGVGSLYPAVLLLLVAIAMLIAAEQSVRLTWVFGGLGGLLIGAFGSRATFLESAQYPAAVSAEAHTDFILRSIESNSRGVAWATIAVAVSLVAYLTSFATSVKNVYCRTLVASASAIIGGGVVFGFMANLGFAPMPATGINLPFMSYGGSLLVGHMALIGLVLGVYRRRNLHLI